MTTKIGVGPTDFNNSDREPTGSGHRNMNLYAVQGDSTKAQLHADQDYRIKSNWNEVGWAFALSGQRGQCVLNAAYSGLRSDHIHRGVGLDGLPIPKFGTAAVVASRAGVVFLAAGTNDIAQANITGGYVSVTTGATVTLANVVAECLLNIEQMVLAHRNAGIPATVLYLPCGSTNYTPVMVGRLLALWRGLRFLAIKYSNVRLFDLPRIVLNSLAASTTAISPKTGYFRDEAGTFTHLNVPGAYVGGVELAKIVREIMPAREYLVAGNFNQPTSNGADQLNSNPLFVTQTGGTLSNGATGVVPGGWNIRISTNASGSAALAGANPIARADGGPGYEYPLTFSGGVGDVFRLQQDIPFNYWSMGGTYESGADINVVTDPGGVAGIYDSMLVNIDGISTNAMDLYADTTHGVMPAGPKQYQLRTDPYTLPMGTTKGYVAHYIVITLGATIAPGNPAVIGIRQPTFNDLVV